MRLKYFVKFLIIGFLQLNVLFSCVGSPVRKPGKSGRNYPPHWWQAFDKSVAYSWEILPQEAKEGEVILSKRNELGILSNFAQTPFVFRGKKYESLEGFWQMMWGSDVLSHALGIARQARETQQTQTCDMMFDYYLGDTPLNVDLKIKVTITAEVKNEAAG